jgi:tetratricopeptide (TPR) repeat protein
MSGTRRARRGLIVALAILGLAVPAGRAFAGCKLGKLAELPVTMVGSRPVVSAQINGSDAQFIADSGAFFSMITPASAAQFKLALTPAPWGLRVRGVGGEINVSVATVKLFTLAGIPIRNIEFLVGGSEPGSGSAGVLGQNVFSIGDVEYDLAKGAIRLMHPDDCGRTTLAYWVTGGEPYSIMNIDATTRLAPHTTGTAFINGAHIRVMFDTGAATSVLSLSAAKRAGVTPETPGVVDAGYWHGIGRRVSRSWIAHFSSFKIGEEEVRNARLRIGDVGLENADMLIGADFFLSHRIYVASSQHKLYFTYNGGPVFNLAALPSTRAAGDAAPESPAPLGAADEPGDAAGFSRRGAAFAARRDYEHAIADLIRACELAPEEPNYFYQRGMIRLENKQPAQAMEDFGQALTLNPDDVPALVARADLRLKGRDTAGAAEDLDAVDRVAAKEADVRYVLARDYQRADLKGPALAQYDLWIAAHADDSRLAEALNGRCGLRALSGEDLAKALADCNAALKLAPKSSPASARILDTRGLVELRLGDVDHSIADFDAALKLQPQDAWALYGRGANESRRGNIAQAQLDMAAAIALWPAIADEFKKRGIPP